VLQLSNMRLRSFDLDYLDLYWDAVPGEDPLDYEFQVLRSESEFGPFFEISHSFSDRYHFRDTTAAQMSFFRRWYYKIRVTPNDENKSATDYPSGPGVALSALPDLEALEMARQERLRLNEFKGRKVWVFPVRTFGQRCTCYDPVTQNRTRSSCLTCFDTGFVGGFHTPLQISMEIIDPQEFSQNTDMAKLQPVNAAGKLANFPVIQENWIVIEAENVRWRVAGPINRFQKLRSVFRQQFALHRIPKDDVTFKLPISIADYQNLQASPARQFTNPHNLEAAKGFAVVAGLELTASAPLQQKAQESAGIITTAATLATTATNASSSTLPKNEVVAMVPGSHPDANSDGVVPSDANGAVDASDPSNRLSDFFGIIQEDTLPGAKATIVRFGQVKVNKAESETWAAGDSVFLSAVAGKASSVAPVDVNSWVKVIGTAAETETGIVGLVDLAPQPKIQI
jgi:hypothetical protein